MALQPINKLKEAFKALATPTDRNFWDLIDSMLHKSEKMPLTQVMGLNDALRNTATKQEVESIEKELPNFATKDDLLSVMEGLNPMGSAENLLDLETKPKRDKDSYFVKDQLNENKDPYIFKYDAELAKWINTEQTVYKNVAPKKNKEGDLVVYEPDGIINLHKYELDGFGGADWKTNINLSGADESYYSYENYLIDEYIPIIGVRVKDEGKTKEIKGKLLIARVTVANEKFTLDKKLEVDFKTLSNGRGEAFLFPNIELKNEYVGCHIFMRVHSRLMQYSKNESNKSVYSIGANTDIGEISSNLNILYSFITVKESNSILPLQQKTDELKQYNNENERSIYELKTFESTTYFDDDFNYNQGWKPLDGYPLSDFTIANNVLTTKFSVNTHQAIEVENPNVEIGKEYPIEIVLRRLTNKGGSLDIGSTFGANIGDGSIGYKTIVADDITDEFQTFYFSVKFIENVFIIGTHQSRNKGDVFEIQSVNVSNIESKMMREVVAIKKAMSIPELSDLQKAINENRDLRLGAGVWEISKPLIIPSNTKISGVRGGTIFKLVGDAVSIVNLTAGSKDITLDNISFQGLTPIGRIGMSSNDVKDRKDAGTQCGIYATGYAQNIHIRNCEFINFNLAGINLYRTHKLYTRTFKISDCVFGESYFGLLSDVRSEYHTVTGCTFAYNRIGAFIAGGNNFMGTCHFDANSVGCVVSGTLGDNDSHGSIVGCSFNHNISYSLCAIDINNGFTFSGCHCFDGNILLNNATGFLFSGGIIAAGIEQININEAVNMIHSTLFIKSYGGGNMSDSSRLSLMGNKFIDGSDSNSINS